MDLITVANAWQTAWWVSLVILMSGGILMAASLLFAGFLGALAKLMDNWARKVVDKGRKNGR